MAKVRTVLSSSMDKHGALAAQQAQAWEEQASERLEIRYPLANLTPSPKNPRRISLDKAGVTGEKVAELAIRGDETLEQWFERMDQFLTDLQKTDPVASEVWSDLFDMALSIRTSGLLQPIVANHDGVIIAGERRWTASLLASLANGRVLLRKMNSVSETVSRFIENIQRKDLSLAETVSGLRDVMAEMSGEPCHPENEAITIKAIRELMGKGQTQSALFRSFCRLPDDDPVLRGILNGAYTDKEVAYEDAKKRLSELRKIKAGIELRDTEEPVDDQSSGSTPKGKAGPRVPAIKARLPGTEGGKVFLNAVATIPELPDPVLERINYVREHWTGAPDKVRRNLMATLLDTLFDELDALDDLEPDATEGAA